MSEQRLRVGVLGCGARAAVYCDDAARLTNMRLSAFADVKQAAADAFLAAYGGDYSTNDAARVLADPQIDAVLICTWHDTHTEYALQAARHGKHILIEKPMALTIDECWRIERAATQAGVTVCIGHKMRFMPLVRRVKQLVGQPLLLVGQMMNNRVPDDVWSLQPGVGGGTVLGAGCHTADLLCYLAGADPVEVYAAGNNAIHQTPGMVDNVVATVRFANGVIAALIHGDAGRNPYASTFFCEIFGLNRGACLYDRFHQAALWGFEQNRLGVEDMSASERADIEGDYALLEQFVACALQHKPAEAGAREGRVATTLMNKILESVRTGLPQRVEVEWRGRYE